jgi:hypothetical protein
MVGLASINRGSTHPTIRSLVRINPTEDARMTRRRCQGRFNPMKSAGGWRVIAARCTDGPEAEEIERLWRRWSMDLGNRQRRNHRLIAFEDGKGIKDCRATAHAIFVNFVRSMCAGSRYSNNSVRPTQLTREMACRSTPPGVRVESALKEVTMQVASGSLPPVGGADSTIKAGFRQPGSLRLRRH